MRKFMNIFAAALVMLAAASCEKNETLPDNNSEGKVVTLKASINNGETKVSLGNKSGEIYPVLWSEGDEIAVAQFVGSDIRVYKFTLTAGKGTQNGTFTCDDAEGFDPLSEATVAVYPYTTQLNFFVVQTNQNYAEKSFDSDAILMMASMEDGSLKFNNLLGILKLTIKGAYDETVSSIELTANKPISGNAKFFDTGEGPFIVTEGPDADYKNNIVLNCPDVAIDTEKEFLITVPAGTYDFAVTINTNKGSYYKSTTNKEILNSVILKMPPLDLTDFENSMSYVENGVYLGDGIALPAGEGKTIIWAPVNCGYDAVNFKYGKLYQWGRKDGQGYYYSETFANNDLGGELSTTEGPISWDSYIAGNYSNVFIKNKVTSDEVRDWLSAPESGLWGNGTKTGHDPCPAGWRVPTSDEMKSLSSGFSTSNYPGASDKNKEKFESEKGYYFYGVTNEASAVNKVFFPASGQLLPNGECGTWYDSDDNQKPNRGYTGYYWTSTTNGTYSHSLIFGKIYDSAGDYGPEGGWYYQLRIKENCSRASGFSVRCVKDMPQSQPMPGSN